MKKYLSFLLILTLLFSLPVFSASAESNCPIFLDEGFEIAVLYDESREANNNVRIVPIADLLSILEQKNISRMIPSRNRDTIKDGIALKLFGEGVKPRSFFISSEGDVLYASDNVAPWAKEAVLQLMTDGHIYRDYRTGKLLADSETVFAADGAMDRLTALRWLCDLFEKACGNVSSDETTEETVQPTE